MNPKQTPGNMNGESAPHIRSRDEVEAMSQDHARKALKENLMKRLNTEHTTYNNLSDDSDIRLVRVERSDKTIEDNWQVMGYGSTDTGESFVSVGRTNENGHWMNKTMLREKLEALNPPEAEADSVEAQRDLGWLAMRLGEIKSPQAVTGTEVSPEPADTAEKVDFGRFAQLLDPDYDDGLTDAERVAAAEVMQPKTQDEIDDEARRLAENKYNQVRAASGSHEEADAASSRIWQGRKIL